MRDAEGNDKAVVILSTAQSWHQRCCSGAGYHPPRLPPTEIKELKEKTIFTRPSLELLKNHVEALHSSKAFLVPEHDYLQVFKDHITTLEMPPDQAEKLIVRAELLEEVEPYGGPPAPARIYIKQIGDLPVLAPGEDGIIHRLLIRNVRYSKSFLDTLFSVDQFFEDSSVEVRFAKFRHVHLPASDTAPAVYLPFICRANGTFTWSIRPEIGEPGSRPSVPGARCLASGLHRPKSKAHIGNLSSQMAGAAVHRRLHLRSDIIRKLPKLTADAPDNLAGCQHIGCGHCAEANASRHPHSGKAYAPSHPGRLVHGDIVGPFKTSRFGYHKRILILVDDHSRFKTAIPLRKKSEAPAKLTAYVAGLNAIGRKHDWKLGSLHTDNAGEFLAHEFAEFLDGQGVAHTTCPPARALSERRC